MDFVPRTSPAAHWAAGILERADQLPDQGSESGLDQGLDQELVQPAGKVNSEVAEASPVEVAARGDSELVQRASAPSVAVVAAAEAAAVAAAAAVAVAVVAVEPAVSAPVEYPERMAGRTTARPAVSSRAVVTLQQQRFEKQL